MPAYPPAALDDVEAASQRAVLDSQNLYRLRMAAVGAAAQTAIDDATFIAGQARLAFLGLMSQGGANHQSSGAILDSRSTRDQPNVSPSIAYVPNPAGAPQPAVAAPTPPHA